MNLASKIFLSSMNGAAGFLFIAYAFVASNALLTMLMLFTGILNLALCVAHFIIADKDAKAEQYSKDWWG